MHACHQCGYDMTGLVKPGAVAVCPECGASGYVEVFASKPHLHPAAAAWRLCRWAITWCSICALLHIVTITTGSFEAGVLLLIAAPIAFASGWYGALHEGWTLAVECEPPGIRRRRYWRRLVTAGLILNLLVGAAYLTFAFVLLVVAAPFP